MNPNKFLDLLQAHYDYFDYLVSVTREPHAQGVLRSINKQINILNRFLNSQLDAEALERAEHILKQFKNLRERHYHIHKKHRK